jgi:hypothetical protein
MAESVTAYRASQQQALDDAEHHGHDRDGKPAPGCALATRFRLRLRAAREPAAGQRARIAGIRR